MPTNSAAQARHSRPRGLPIENGSIAVVRSFADAVTERLTTTFPVTTLGLVDYRPFSYPILRLCTFAKHDARKPTILLSGGVHGDEPAGVFALMRFLSRLSANPSLLDKAQFVIYPCVNPSGFEADTLKTMPGTRRGFRRGSNLNRLFGTKNPPQEIRLIQDDLARLDLEFLFTMDMHEAPPYYVGEGYTKQDNPRACWIYETHRDPSKRIGRAVMDSLPADVEACDWPLIYDDVNDRGLIAFLPETTGNAAYAQCTSFDGYVFDRYTRHSFTTETPTGWSLEKRIRTQLHYLTKALEQTLP